MAIVCCDRVGANGSHLIRPLIVAVEYSSSAYHFLVRVIRELVGWLCRRVDPSDLTKLYLVPQVQVQLL